MTSLPKSPATHESFGQANDERLEGWVRGALWYLSVAAIGILATSLVATLWWRMYGGYQWNELAGVGEFWGGHLNAIVLIILAFGLYLQRKEIKLHNEALRHTIDTHQFDHTENVVRRLRDLANEFPYRERRSNTNRMGKGIRNLATVLEERQNVVDTQVYIDVIVDFKRLSAYVARAQGVQKMVSALPVSSQEELDVTGDEVWPPAVFDFCGQLQKERDEALASVEAMNLAPHGNRRLRALILSGKAVQIFDTHGTHLVSITDETTEGWRKYESDSHSSNSRDQAVESALSKLDADEAIAFETFSSGEGTHE